jgi:hypothetical protein
MRSSTHSSAAAQDALERVRSALKRSQYPELRRVEVSLRLDTLHLKGKVSCYFMKQMAQEVARSPERSLLICNELQVAHAPAMSRPVRP